MNPIVPPMNHCIDKIRLQAAEDRRIYELLKKRLKGRPKGKLYIHRRNGRCSYSVAFKDSSGKIREHYLSCKATETIKAYAEAEYCEKLLKILEKDIKTEENYLKCMDSGARTDVWNKIPAECRVLVDNYFKSSVQICREWELADFETNTFPMDNGDRYITKKGEHVRSRMELLIANLLFDLGIPYRYECRLNLGSSHVYPDFTVMHPQTLEIYYIECFGMMDDRYYAESALKKISQYAGTDKYNRLIMLFDSSAAPLNVPDIEKLLRITFLN